MFCLYNRRNRGGLRRVGGSFVLGGFHWVGAVKLWASISLMYPVHHRHLVCMARTGV